MYRGKLRSIAHLCVNGIIIESKTQEFCFSSMT